jgi:Xaa-Pro dipeptidase
MKEHPTHAHGRVAHPPGILDGEAGWARIRAANSRYWPRFSQEEYARRYAAIRAHMAARDIDCLLMFSQGYLSSANLIYVANYIDIVHGAVVFPRSGEPTVFALAYSFAAQAAAQSVIEDVRWGAGIDHEVIAARLREGGFARATIGIADSLPHELWVYLHEALPQARFVDAKDLMYGVRLCASAEELTWYRRGAELCDAAFAAVAEAARPGLRDHELVGIIHGTYLRLGGSLYGAALGTTPMHDPSVPYSWWVAGGSTRELREGDLILTEITGTYYGYPGQLIRPLALGEPPPELRALEALALELYADIQALVKVGNTPRDVYRCSQRILDAGYSIQCPLIHGYSQVLQPPFASLPGDPCWSAMLDEPFRENQLIVIEPNPVTPDMQRGFFIGDLNVVTPAGAVSLHGAPLEFLVK